jgi:hypothetical protein
VPSPATGRTTDRPPSGGVAKQTRPSPPSTTVWRAGELEATERAYRAGIAKAGSDTFRAATLKLLLARLLHEKGDDKGAMAELKDAVRAAPGHPLVHLLYAEALAKDGDVKGAVVALRQYVALDRGNPAAAALLRELETSAAVTGQASGRGQPPAAVGAFPQVTDTYLGQVAGLPEGAAGTAVSVFDAATRWRPDGFKYRGLPPPPLRPKALNDPRMKPLLEDRSRLQQRGRELLEEEAKLEGLKASGAPNSTDVQSRIDAVKRELTTNTDALNQNQEKMVDLGVKFEEETKQEKSR